MEECCHSAGHHEAGANPRPTDTAAAPGTLRFIVPALLVVMVVLGIQTLQLVGLQRTLKGGVAQASTSAPAAAAPSDAAPPLPSSLQNLPNMVGGC